MVSRTKILPWAKSIVPEDDFVGHMHRIEQQVARKVEKTDQRGKSRGGSGVESKGHRREDIVTTKYGD